MMDLTRSQPTLRVALVEDDPHMQQRLLHALGQDATVEVVWAGESVRACRDWLQDQAASQAPEVLLVDLGLPDGSGIEVIQACRRLHPACDVMVVTLFADDASLLEAFGAGASGYLLKDGSEFELMRHMRDLRSGGSPMSPMIARRLLQHWQRQEAGAAPQTRPGDGELAPVRQAPHAAAVSVGAGLRAGEASETGEYLTTREGAVLNLIARGFTYDEAGRQLAMSTHTVRTHVRNIYAKLDVHNKAEAVFQARALGWLE